MADTRVMRAPVRDGLPLIYTHGAALAVWSIMLPLSSPQLMLAVFSLLSLIYLARYNDRGLTHPVAVFTLFFYPYSTWFIYYALARGGYNEVLLAEVLKLEFLGLWTFSVACDVVALLMSRGQPKPTRGNSANHAARLSVFVPIAGSGAVMVLALFDAMTSGALTKGELLERGSELGALSGPAGVVLTAGAILIAMSVLRERGVRAMLGHPILLLLFLVMLASMAILGERDYVFRLSFCLLVVYFSYKRNASLGVMLLLLVGLVAVLPLSQASKGLLLPGSGFGSNFSINDIFLGEFLASGRNIYILLDHGVEHNFGFLFSDLARGLLPLSGDGLQSAGNWYNTVYRHDNDLVTNSGWGFSLVAEGYLLGRYWGVVVVMALVGILAQTLYALRARSDYWFAFHVLALSAIVYCIRADIANVLSQTIKIGGATVAIYWLAHIVLLAPEPVAKVGATEGKSLE